MIFIKKHIYSFIILLFHTVGFFGLILNPDYFKALSPLNLMLSVVLILISSKQTQGKFYLILCLIALLGFTIEVIGVKTEFIFGSYHYGQSLGITYWSVPLLIGVNWAILLYATAQWSFIKQPILNALFGAILMVLLDFFIEQSAARFDFWYWKGNIIPMQNYIAWFLIAFILNMLFQKYLCQKPNLTAKVFYLIQIIFFATLFFIN